MSDYNKPVDLWREIQQLKKQVDRLERANRLTNASIKEGALSILDSTGKVRLKIGKQLDNAYVGRGWDSSGEGVNDPVWDTGFDQLKVVQKGTFNAAKAANSNNQQTFITHSLGYIPAFLAFLNSPTFGWTPLQYQEMNIDLDQTARLTSLLSIFAHADSSKFYVEIACGSSGSYFTSSLSLNIRYYLLTETAN